MLKPHTSSETTVFAPILGVDWRWALGRAKSVVHSEGLIALLRRVAHRLTSVVRGESAITPFASDDRRRQYRAWQRQHALTSERIDAIRKTVPSLGRSPVLSFAMPLTHDRPQWVTAAIGSFIAQVYPHWELWIYAAGQVHEQARQVAEKAAHADARIKFIGQTSADPITSMLSAFSTLPKETFVGLLRPDAELAPHALYEFARRAAIHPDVDVLFSDHDVITPEGEHVDPFFKTGWNPDLLLSMDYLSPLCVFRRSALPAIEGGEVSHLECAIHRLLLRVTETARRIEHIPDVLCHTRAGSEEHGAIPESTASREEGVSMIADTLRRRDELAGVAWIAPGRYRITFESRGSPLISIVIPTRDRYDLLSRCINSIEQHTSDVRYEIIVVDNGSTEDRTLRFLDSIACRHRVLRHPQAFNYSAINNAGVACAAGDYVLFLNNDTEVLEPAWLSSLLAQAQRPGVGAVGAKLLYPDGRIQHAGVVLGVCGIAGHAFRFLGRYDASYQGLSDVVRNCSAVTAACLLMRKELFEEVGGFNTRLRIEYNDVDLCLRLRQRGLRIVYDPQAVLIHHENATRRSGRSPQDRLLMEDLWGDLIKQGDPFYNPNLTSVREDWSLRLS